MPQFRIFKGTITDLEKNTYSVEVDLYKKIDYDERLAWCNHNLVGGYVAMVDRFYFYDEADAVMFKLRWE